MLNDLTCQQCKRDIVPMHITQAGNITTATFAPGVPVRYYTLIGGDDYEDEVMYLFCSDTCLWEFEAIQLR